MGAWVKWHDQTTNDTTKAASRARALAHATVDAVPDQPAFHGWSVTVHLPVDGLHVVQVRDGLGALRGSLCTPDEHTARLWSPADEADPVTITVSDCSLLPAATGGAFVVLLSRVRRSGSRLVSL